MGLARAVRTAVVVVGDIDRGGVLASMYGTWALLDEDDQAQLKPSWSTSSAATSAVLSPGWTHARSDRRARSSGCCPSCRTCGSTARTPSPSADWRGRTARPAAARDLLKVAVVRLPRISNATDVDALAAEPGVDVLVTVDPAVVGPPTWSCSRIAFDAVGPGVDAVERGLADVAVRRVRQGRPVLGICGGYQMLGREIVDDVEGRIGAVPGLDQLPVRVEFGAAKVLARPTGSWEGHLVDTAYEIHHGIAGRVGSDDVRKR